MRQRLHKASLFFLLLLPSFLWAQIPKSVDNVLRSNGRIYVVVTVILIILIGLFLYMMRIEKKINRLRKDNK